MDANRLVRCANPAAPLTPALRRTAMPRQRIKIDSDNPLTIELPDGSQLFCEVGQSENWGGVRVTAELHGDGNLARFLIVEPRNSNQVVLKIA